MRRRTAHLLRRFANKLDPQDFREVVQPGAFRKTQESPIGFLTYNGEPVDLEKVLMTALRKHNRRNGERLA